jgi:uncharacterized protein (TIGR02118 family)
MIRVSIPYPNSKDSRFDFSCYVEVHMPMSIARLSAHRGFKGVCVEQGLGGTALGSPPARIATGHFLFDSVGEFLAALTPHAEVLQGARAARVARESADGRQHRCLGSHHVRR